MFCLSFLRDRKGKSWLYLSIVENQNGQAEAKA